MLLNFSVKNYKNFKEKQTLEFCCGKNKKIIPSIAIYGENGSGKSNILKALYLVKDLICRPIGITTPTSGISNNIFLDSFKLDTNFSNKPSCFEIEFVIDDLKQDNNHLKYRFECNNKEITSETLENKNNKTNKYNFIYKRTNNSVAFNEKLEISKAIKQKLVEKNIELQKYQNILFLNLLWNERISPAYEIFRFFAEKIFVLPNLINNGETSGLTTIAKIKENRNNDKEKIINFLNSVNINIEDIEIKSKEVDIPTDINPFSNQVVYTRGISNMVTFFRKNNKNIIVPFNIEEESDGTIKLFSLIGDILKVLENGLTIFFDELDKSLHIELIKYIIELFNNKKINKKGAQLIFTTHNVSLLSNKFDLFKKEQVYIIDKKYSGESELYSLNDVMGINGRSIENLYLNGLLGGTPHIVGV